MYRQISSIVSVILVGSIATTMPSVVSAQTRIAQKSSPEVVRLLQEGRRLVGRGNYDRAIAIYRRAATLEPKNHTIPAGIGFLQAQKGDFRGALISYRRAIALNPNSSDYYYAVAYVHGNLGNMKGAKEAYRKSIQLDRNNKNAYLGLMVTQSRLGDYGAVRWAYQKLLEIDPRNARAYELMGGEMKKRGRRQEAIAQLRKARDLYQRQGKADGANRVEGVLRGLGV
ncbi:MAG: tetratricopeptide repeat protein [Calothrix sp. MO_167.B12]|nr:tetratricopeptide repeat protein [Calothrix sp. MO_167.B12]